jgi:hypothetical protein
MQPDCKRPQPYGLGQHSAAGLTKRLLWRGADLHTALSLVPPGEAEPLDWADDELDVLIEL